MTFVSVSGLLVTRGWTNCSGDRRHCCSWMRPERSAYGSARRVSRLSGKSVISTTMTVSKKAERIQTFLKDAEGLGTVRFINMSAGSVLETIGRFDYGVRVFETPRGEYVSISTTDRTFECHLNTEKVAKITMSKEAAKMGGHDLFVIRFRDEDEEILLSCLLMWNPSEGPGQYLAHAVESFNVLMAKYGGSYDLA
eukprot:CAMPEP_0184680376 /NCGR_PEP_ID=MMETSP0312-20130426/3245_1 /TAXON_ID=31354 /ORGANISM="Compsopogon coeruleus, Strain SAG 36.94" /LENGTH=195 /DNA_ID=CAMNT_0027130425 /DNA_START=39 /DNA_END=626 /DNA_ORIENTATION=-